MRIKEYIGKQLVGKRLHLHCDCTVPIDVTGVVVDYYVVSRELFLKVQRSDGKIFDIGENHPSLNVEELK